MKKFFLLFLILSFTTQLSYAQREAVNWFFGTNAGITFINGAPEPLAGGQLATHEGCATISDAKGNLLFYTDGRTVINKEHQVMQGIGMDPLKGDYSATQSGVIVPKPGEERYYYIFTVDKEGDEDGFRYSLVDMNQDSYRGEVVFSHKNKLLQKSSTEKVTAVKHANGEDYWVIMHEVDNNRFHVYLVDDNTDFTPTLVQSPEIGTAHMGVDNTRGYMKSSPDGTKLAVAITDDGIVELFDFDNATGDITQVVATLQDDEYKNVYGLEFSSDASKLYFSTEVPSRLFQVDLDNGNQVTKIFEDTDNNRKVCALQIAPDAKIYAANMYDVDDEYLSVINNPNEAGTACNFSYIQLYLGGDGRRSRLGLPTFIQSFFQPEAGIQTNSPICEHDTLRLSTTDVDGQYSWTGPNGLTHDEREWVIPDAGLEHAGMYYVEVTVLGNSSVDSIEVVVDIDPYVELIEEDTIWFCANEPYTIYAETNDVSYDVIRWTGVIDSVGTESLVISETGLYNVRVENQNGCYDEDWVYAIKYDTARIVMMYEGSLIKCSGTIDLSFWTNVMDYDFEWSNGETSESIIITESGDYTVTVTDSNGCVSTSSVHCHIGSPEPKIIASPSVRLCPGQTAILSADLDYDVYSWILDGNEISTEKSIEVSEPGVYTLEVTEHFEGEECSGETSAEISIIDFDEYFANFESDFGKIHFGNSDQKVISLNNVGIDDIRIESITFSGVPDGIYSITPATDVQFYQGDNVDFTLTFSPDQIMIYDATMTLNITEPCEFQYEVPIKGIGSAVVEFKLSTVRDTVGRDVSFDLTAQIIDGLDRTYTLPWNGIEITYDARAMLPFEESYYSTMADVDNYVQYITLNPDSKEIDSTLTILATIPGQLLLYTDGIPSNVSWIDLQEDVIDTVKSAGAFYFEGLCKKTYSIVDEAEALEVKIQPNPSGSVVNFDVTSDEQGEYTIEIYSVNGTKIYSEKYYNPTMEAFNINRKVDLENISNGVYTLVVTSNYQKVVKPLLIFK